jgi:hypothetical protein
LLSSIRFAFAGGQDEHPWLVKSSITTGRFAASAETASPPIAHVKIAHFANVFMIFIFYLSLQAEA